MACPPLAAATTTTSCRPFDPPPRPCHRCHFEIVVIPCTPAMDKAEVELANALVTLVGGTRPLVSPAQVRQYLS
jgi:hypothetical protein